jgi:nitrate/TMAO reductase-like tetraheme cytochrome c subunit
VNGGACYDCHVIDRTGDAATNGWNIRPVYQPTRYLKNGWFDHKAHATETCVSCHAGATKSNDAQALLLPGLDKSANGQGCRDCHGSEHSKAAVPGTCATCHSYHSGPAQPWRPVAARRAKAGATR